jgi:acyl-CoA hydrolase
MATAPASPLPPPRVRRASLRFLVEPTDLNAGGKVHGGTVMKWIDQAGYACAVGWCGTFCVTVYVGGIRFLRPIAVGSLVELNARLVHTGNTSMHIAVEVRACDPRDGVYERTTQCIIVFVSLGEDLRPRAVPSWEPEDDRDRELNNYATRHHQLWQQIERDLEARPGTP